jgi:hypothetical protein
MQTERRAIDVGLGSAGGNDNLEKRKAPTEVEARATDVRGVHSLVLTYVSGDARSTASS